MKRVRSRPSHQCQNLLRMLRPSKHHGPCRVTLNRREHGLSHERHPILHLNPMIARGWLVSLSSLFYWPWRDVGRQKGLASSTETEYRTD